MKLSTMKRCLSGAMMLTALVVTPALFKIGSANALPPDVAADLNLTPAQQTELEAIKENAHAQVDAILTDDQLAELEGKTGRARRRAMRNLDLSEDQLAQLREVRESSRAEAEQVFTDEQLAQLQTMRANGRKNHREKFAEELNLTPEQQAELDAIKENARTQADAVLTEDQLASLEGKTGRERLRAMRNLDLSEDQRSQLREIRESSRAAADEVLTEDQLAQLEEMRENRGGRRRR